jgi:two-component system response regulator PilR (NtrC family)
MATSNSSTNNTAAGPRQIPRVLVVDDEPDLRELLDLTLVRMGLDVDSVATVGEALDSLRSNRYALCLTDMHLPDASGMELVETVARDYPLTVIAVITAYGSADNAVAALKGGAFDYLSKPVALDQLRSLVQAAVRVSRDASDKAQDKAQPRASGSAEDRVDNAPVARLLGDSLAMREVRAMIRRVARSQAPVVIAGESGCGKELVARAIHDSSGRHAEPFVAVNCGAIPEHLMEAEFFGYRKGAFTGADSDRTGFFQAARGGTLFLDEVAELPLPMQVKLLRVLQERSVRRIGGSIEEPVDVRLVSATHQNLGNCVAQGRFRHDLYYRLNVIGIHIPPLRERRSDIPLLARHLLERIAPEMELTDAALERLVSHEFRGNVRELGNVLERSAAFAESSRVDAGDIHFGSAPVQADVSLAPALIEATGAVGAAIAPLGAPAGAAGLNINGTLPEYLDGIEREVIESALTLTRFNRTAAAELLGITLRQLRYRMQRLNIQ